jgi:hypothetical protein
MADCPKASTGIRTIPSTDQEIQYNDDLTVCDWGPLFKLFNHRAQYSFKNASPVVWWFYDSAGSTAVGGHVIPQWSVMYPDTWGITPMFRQFAIGTGLMPTGWLVSPGETVWLTSLYNVSFTPADPLITAKWLLYKQQADKLKSIGTEYAKRISTNNYESKTRTFLWNCVNEAVTLNNARKTDMVDDPYGSALSWMNAASDGSQCKDSFKDLFQKKLKNHPVVTSSSDKWFSTTNLKKASTFLDDIKSSGETLETVVGIFHFRT